MLYQKNNRDIYATSIDYDKVAKATIRFFTSVQILVMNTKNIENKEMIKNKKRIKYNLSGR